MTPISLRSLYKVGYGGTSSPKKGNSNLSSDKRPLCTHREDGFNIGALLYKGPPSRWGLVAACLQYKAAPGVVYSPVPLRGRICRPPDSAATTCVCAPERCHGGANSLAGTIVRSHPEWGADPHTIAMSHPPEPLSLVCTWNQTKAWSGYCFVKLFSTSPVMMVHRHQHTCSRVRLSPERICLIKALSSFTDSFGENIWMAPSAALFFYCGCPNSIIGRNSKKCLRFTLCLPHTCEYKLTAYSHLFRCVQHVTNT